MKKLLITIFLVILIIILAFIIPLILIDSSSQIYTNMYKSNINNKGTMLSTAYTTLLNSDINNDYKNYVTIIKKTTDSSLIAMQTSHSILFVYYVIFACLLLLATGICIRKSNINISKACIISSTILIICILLYVVF